MNLSYPLTTMEEFLYWEDRPSYPWSCFLRLRFAGGLDRAALESALRTALPRHPLLAAKVESAGWRGLRWRVAAEPAPRLTWETGALHAGLPRATHLDLRQEIGLRVHVSTDSVASDLTLQFHHACCDGAGIFLFAHDLLIAYALAKGVEDLALPPFDAGTLGSRGRFGLSVGKLCRLLPQQLPGLAGARQFLMRSPTPLLPHQACADDAPLPPQYPAICSGVVKSATLRALRRTATEHGVTLNDLLARDLFLALADWRAAQGIEGNGDWLRMMVPMSLRNADTKLLPAANMVSCVFLDRHGAHFVDGGRLLAGIHEEMDHIKRQNLGYTFVFSTALARLLPGGLRRQVRTDKCTVSCIFTNLGKLFLRSPLPRQGDKLIAGNVTLESMDLVAPIRPYSCVTVAVGLYADELGVTLHYDPRPVSREQAGELLDTFLRRLQQSAGTSPTDAPRAPTASAAAPLDVSPAAAAEVGPVMRNWC